jgi:hypothetical protein
MSVAGRPLHTCSQRSSPRRIFCFVCLIIMAVPTIEACGKIRIPGLTSSITVDREVVRGEVDGRVTAIARMPGGGFAVAGVRGTAWAVATNSDGDFLWKYADAPDARVATQDQSKFYGSAALPGGNLLFFGSKTVNVKVDGAEVPRDVGLITILDRQGGLVEQRLLFPNGNQDFSSSAFGRFVQRADGILLVGAAADEKRAFAWLMKLDNHGALDWEKLVPDVPPGEAAETADHNLVMSRFDSRDFALIMVRTDLAGVVAARRALTGYRYLRLRNVEPSNTVRAITYGVEDKATLHTLNERLEDAQPPREIARFNTAGGFGYVLPDNSLALFGKTDSPAVAWIGESGRAQYVHTFGATSTLTIGDAVALAGNRFVVAGIRFSRNPAERGLVLYWISLK